MAGFGTLIISHRVYTSHFASIVQIAPHLKINQPFS
jgi:hypothetical protein